MVTNERCSQDWVEFNYKCKHWLASLKKKSIEVIINLNNKMNVNSCVFCCRAVCKHQSVGDRSVQNSSHLHSFVSICEVNCNLSTLSSCGVHSNAAIVHVFADCGCSLVSAEISNSKNFWHLLIVTQSRTANAIETQRFRASGDIWGVEWSVTDEDTVKENRDDWEHSAGVTQCGLLLS